MQLRDAISGVQFRHNLLQVISPTPGPNKSFDCVRDRLDELWEEALKRAIQVVQLRHREQLVAQYTDASTRLKEAQDSSSESWSWTSRIPSSRSRLQWLKFRAEREEAWKRARARDKEFEERGQQKVDSSEPRDVQGQYV
eukprot:1226939-Rhodomonas_salina.2